MPPLESYKKKRDPKKTPEPFGGKSGKAKGKPDLRRRSGTTPAGCTIDFRIERDGALASWAVPKGIPLRHGAPPPRRACRGPPARLRDLRGRDPAGRVRRRAPSRSGTRPLRAGRGEARRRADRAPARRAPERPLDAHPGPDGRRPEATGSSCARTRATGGRPRRAEADAGRSPRPSSPVRGDWLYEVKWTAFVRSPPSSAARPRCAAATATISRPASPRWRGRCRAPSERRLRPRRRGVRARRGWATPVLAAPARGGDACVYLFDLLVLDGDDVTARRSPSGKPASGRDPDRRRRSSGSRWRSTTGRRCSTQARAHGLEGIVAKRAVEHLPSGTSRRGLGEGEVAATARSL